MGGFDHRVMRTALPALVMGTCLGLGAAAREAEILPGASLGLAAGYEYHRLPEPQPESSAFLESEAGLSLLVFQGNWESALSLEHEQYLYEDSDSETRSDTRLDFGLKRMGAAGEVGVDLGAGLYSDAALPYEDRTYWDVRPVAVYSVNSVPMDVIASLSARRLSYDAADAAGEARDDTLMSGRIHLYAYAWRRTSLWFGGYLSRNTSSWKTVEYEEPGGFAGARVELTPRSAIRAWGEAGYRKYDVSAPNGDSSETPVRMGVRWEHRLRPWLDILATAEGERSGADVEGNEGLWWFVSSGVRATWE